MILLTGTSLADAPDAELVVAARHGDDRASAILVWRYQGLVCARARNYFLAGADFDDLCQEGLIGLHEAIQDFDAANGSFPAFAELCVTRQMLSAVKAAGRRKHAPLNDYVPLRPSTDQDADPAVTVMADRPEADADPLDALVADDSLRQLLHVVEDVLSRLETRVLYLYTEGRSYQEIADLLGRQVKTIDNAVQRTRRKLEATLPMAG